MSEAVLDPRLINPHFMLVPSLTCPASCSYCFGPNDGPVMDRRMIPDVLSFMERIVGETGQQTVEVTLHGGEPLAAGYEIIEALITGLHDAFRTKDLHMSVQSNLWLLDGNFCELFSKYNVGLGTSLDGPRALNDGQRGQGYFDKTMAGIRLAQSRGIHVNCIATFTARTLPHWREIFGFFLSQNLHFNVHHAVSPVDGGAGMGITPEQYERLFTDMFDYYTQRSGQVKIGTFDQLCRGIVSGRGRVCTFCDCYGMFLCIDPPGDIYSCQRFAGKKEYRLGSVMDDPSILELVHSPAARMLRKREVEIAGLCEGCEHYPYCRGGCPYNAFAKSDGSDPRDRYCDAYREIFDHIKRRIHEDMISDENQRAIARYGPSDDGNPLLRSGPVINLTKEHAHPYDVTRTAKRIIAAYELGRGGSMADVAARLARRGICETCESAVRSLTSMMRRMDPAGKLNKLYLHVTFSCQLACAHCYACAGDTTDGQEMNAADIEKLIDQACQIGFREVIITGGEPLMLGDFDDLLNRLPAIRERVLPVPIVLRTNFVQRLTQEDLTRLSAAFSEIVVSIDGGEVEHDRRRGRGVYRKTVVNLQQYMDMLGGEEYRPENSRPAFITLAASLTTEDMTGLPGTAVRELSEQLGIGKVKFRPLLPLGRAADQPLAAQPLLPYMLPADILERGYHPVMSCGIGQNLYVEPSGEVFPCYAYHKPHAYLGNVLRDGLDRVVKSEGFQSLRTHTVDTNIRCKSCEWRYLCGGACRAWSWEAAQYDLDAAPLECEALRNRAEGLYRAALNYLSIE